MRIKSLLAVCITGLTLAVTGCGTEAQLAPQSTPAPVEQQATSSQPSGQVEAMAACQLKWTCDYTHYYSTQAQCKTACGTQVCERDYACTGGCICP